MSDKPWGMAVGPDLNDNEQPRIVAGGELMAAEELRERLAAYAHKAWSGWTEYMFKNCWLDGDPARPDEMSLVIPPDLVTRWSRQMNTPYAELPESEKESDRNQADKIIRVISASSALEVIRPGSQVSIADGKITATVTAVALYAHGGTLYEVAWWHEGQRMSEWIAEGEIGAEQEKINVGFR